MFSISHQLNHFDFSLTVSSYSVSFPHIFLLTSCYLLVVSKEEKKIESWYSSHRSRNDFDTLWSLLLWKECLRRTVITMPCNNQALWNWWSFHSNTADLNFELWGIVLLLEFCFCHANWQVSGIVDYWTEIMKTILKAPLHYL